MPLEMGTSSWCGFARAEAALDGFLRPTGGLGRLTQTMEQGSAGRNSIPLGGVVWLNGGCN